MIFIVGGRKQGKEAFAREHFPEWKDEKCADGKSASWEEFLKTNFGINLHEMVRRRMEEGAKAEELERDMAEELLRECPERILITDEIGCGIVPMDAFSRCYREVVGRICCQLAGKAQEVWRVTAGIGQKIKQKGETIMTQEKKGQKTAGINEQVMSGEELDSLRKQAGDAVREFLAVGKMEIFSSWAALPVRLSAHVSALIPVKRLAKPYIRRFGKNVKKTRFTLRRSAANI